MQSSDDSNPVTPTAKPPEKNGQPPKEMSYAEREDKVRRHFAKMHRNHPEYAARAARTPNFWETYSVGAPFMFPDEDLEGK